MRWLDLNLFYIRGRLQ